MFGSVGNLEERERYAVTVRLKKKHCVRCPRIEVCENKCEGGDQGLLLLFLGKGGKSMRCFPQHLDTPKRLPVPDEEGKYKQTISLFSVYKFVKHFISRYCEISQIL